MDVYKLWLLIFILFCSCHVLRAIFIPLPAQSPPLLQMMHPTMSMQQFSPQFNNPDEFFTSWNELQATCNFINRDNPGYKAIPYSGFFDQLCKVAKAFMPTKKDIEAVAKQAEPAATSLQLPRLRKLRERIEQRARSMQAELKLSSKSSDKSKVIRRRE